MAKNELQLLDSVHTTSAIICNKCWRESGIHCDDSIEAALHFYKKGWRVVRGRDVCPKCFKKKPKSKSK